MRVMWLRPRNFIKNGRKCKCNRTNPNNFRQNITMYKEKFENFASSN